MEIKKAIEILDRYEYSTRLEVNDCVKDRSCDDITVNQFYKMKALAKQSLEKQIHKRVDIYDYGKAHCPECKTDIHGIGRINHCFHCGQRVIWR